MAAGKDPYGHAYRVLAPPGRPGRAVRRPRGRRVHRGRGAGGRPRHGEARSGQARLPRAARLHGRHPAVLPHQRAGRGRVRRAQGLGRGRLGRRRGHDDAHEARAAVRGRGVVRAAQQVAAPAAREVPRPGRQGDALPPALRGPRHEPRGRARSRSASRSFPPSAATWRITATTRWRRPSCIPSSAERTRAPSSRTTTRSTRISTCASPPSCTSSACWWAASRRCSRSGASSATRAWTRTITPSSPRWSSTRRSATWRA